MTRRALFVGILALGVWLAVEALAFAAFWIQDGALYRPGRIASEREEIVAEARVRTETTSRDPDAFRREVIHPYLGYVYNPAYTGVALDPGATQKEVVNGFGFLDPNLPLHRRAPDRLIVAIVGGSVAKNFVARGAGVLASELARSESFAGREIVFVRLGVAGFKQPQQLFAIQYLLTLGAEFDYVIALDGFNEVALHAAENARHRVFPAYPRNWYLRVQSLPDAAARERVGEIVYLRASRARWAERFEGLLGRSVLASFVWRARDRGLRSEILAAEEWLRGYEPSQRSYVVEGPSLPDAEERDPYEELAAIWARSSLQLHRSSEANGMRYLHFLQPNQYLEGTKVLSEAERKGARLGSHAYREGALAGYPHLLREGERLREAGVPFFDLTRIFEDVEETIYVDNCCHMNERGHELIAKRIAAEIVAAAEGS